LAVAGITIMNTLRANVADYPATRRAMGFVASERCR
jgi:hypothetical protein